MKAFLTFIIMLCISLFNISAQIKIDENNNVGIGQSSPETKLHVGGKIKIDSLAGEIMNIIMADSTGELKKLYLGSGLTVNNGVLNVVEGDSSIYNELPNFYYINFGLCPSMAKQGDYCINNINNEIFFFNNGNWVEWFHIDLDTDPYNEGYLTTDYLAAPNIGYGNMGYDSMFVITTNTGDFNFRPIVGDKITTKVKPLKTNQYNTVGAIIEVDTAIIATKNYVNNFSNAIDSIGFEIDTLNTNVTVTPNALTSNGTFKLSIPYASGSKSGRLRDSDWTKFNNKVGGSGSVNRIAFWKKINPSSSLLELTTSPKFLWDISSENLGIGHTDTTVLQNSIGVNSIGLAIKGTTSVLSLSNNQTTSKNVRLFLDNSKFRIWTNFQTAGDKFTIDSLGRPAFNYLSGNGTTNNQLTAAEKTIVADNFGVLKALVAGGTGDVLTQTTSGARWITQDAAMLYDLQGSVLANSIINLITFDEEVNVNSNNDPPLNAKATDEIIEIKEPGYYNISASGTLKSGVIINHEVFIYYSINSTPTEFQVPSAYTLISSDANKLINFNVNVLADFSNASSSNIYKVKLKYRGYPPQGAPSIDFYDINLKAEKI